MATNDTNLFICIAFTNGSTEIYPPNTEVGSQETDDVESITI